MTWFFFRCLLKEYYFMAVQLIADSGATKCEWCLIGDGISKTIITTGISPYFLSGEQIVALLKNDLIPELGGAEIGEVHFYGTGLGNPKNVAIMTSAFESTLHVGKVSANTDLLAAARALCGNEKGIVCILGTGSNSCYYDG